VIRYKIYQKIKLKAKQQQQPALKAKSTNVSATTNANTTGGGNDDSQTTKNDDSQLIGEDDIKDLVKELEIETISKDVFKLYDVKIGLDTKLSLRKVQVLESSDEMFQSYLECLDEAHEVFLNYILKGYKF